MYKLNKNKFDLEGGQKMTKIGKDKYNPSVVFNPNNKPSDFGVVKNLNTIWGPIRHYRMFEVRYLSATDNNDPRLKIVDERNNESKTLSKDYNFAYSRDQIFNYLYSLGINVEGFAVTDEKDFIFTRDFTTPLK